MCMKTSQYVWQHSKAKGTARLVLLAIADHANDDGEADPGENRLASMAAVSNRTVRTALQDLETAGEIVIQPRSGRTNLYIIPVPWRATPAVSTRAEQRAPRQKQAWVRQATSAPPPRQTPSAVPRKITAGLPRQTPSTEPKDLNTNTPEKEGVYKQQDTGARAKAASSHPLFQAFFNATPDDMQLTVLAGDNDLDACLQLDSINATPDEITTIVKAKWSEPRRTQYRFEWLPRDVPVERRRAHMPPEAGPPRQGVWAMGGWSPPETKPAPYEERMAMLERTREARDRIMGRVAS